MPEDTYRTRTHWEDWQAKIKTVSSLKDTVITQLQGCNTCEETYIFLYMGIEIHIPDQLPSNVLELGTIPKSLLQSRRRSRKMLRGEILFVIDIFK